MMTEWWGAKPNASDNAPYWDRISSDDRLYVMCKRDGHWFAVRKDGTEQAFDHEWDNVWPPGHWALLPGNPFDMAEEYERD